ncbi:hypothetical protein pipiens_013633, partial [Culex pipiens pipiens]
MMQNQQQQSPASTSYSAVEPSSSAIVDVEDELLLNESAVSKLFAADSLAEVQELLELDQIDVDHILNENNFLNNINNLNFLDSVDNNNLLGFDSGVCDGDDGSVLGGNNNGTAGSVVVLDEDTDMQLTQTAMAATLQQQQLKLIGTGNSNNSNGVGSVVSTDESVSALLNAKIDNLLGLGGIGTTAGSGSVGQDQELADLEQESLDEACRNLIRDMNEYGVCVLDNFLGQDRGVKVLQEVTGMYSSGVFRDGQLVSNRGRKNLRHIRGDKITWIEGKEPGCGNIGYLINRVDAVITNCKRMKNNGKLGQYNIRERTR